MNICIKIFAMNFIIKLATILIKLTCQMIIIYSENKCQVILNIIEFISSKESRH